MQPQYVRDKVSKNVMSVMGVGRIFSRGGAVEDFPKIFSRARPKVVKFVFYPSKSKK